jgi:hypothetical protein
MSLHFCFFLKKYLKKSGGRNLCKRNQSFAGKKISYTEETHAQIKALIKALIKAQAQNKDTDKDTPAHTCARGHTHTHTQ